MRNSNRPRRCRRAKSRNCAVRAHLRGRARGESKAGEGELLERSIANGWTPERRARQAALIRTWRPWEHSTGPRTPEGKAQAAENARAFHGWTPVLLAERENICELHREMAELLKLQADLLGRLS